MWQWIKNLFKRTPSGPTIAEKQAEIIEAKNREIERYKDKLVEKISAFEQLNNQFAAVCQERDSLRKLDRRASFELKAAMETKIRVWYREMKNLPPNELRVRFNAVKQEVDNIDAQIKRNRSVEMPNYENVMDFTPNAAHAGLSRTGTK